MNEARQNGLSLDSVHFQNARIFPKGRVPPSLLGSTISKILVTSVVESLFLHNTQLGVWLGADIFLVIFMLHDQEDPFGAAKP